MAPEEPKTGYNRADQPLLDTELTGEDPIEETEDNGGSGGNSGPNGNANTESRSGSRSPTPTKREYAIRRYHGIGPDGEPIDEVSSSTLADRLGVSSRTINRWVNEEEIPLVDGWSTQQRLTLYACVITRDRMALEEYLQVLDLETAAERGSPVTSQGREDGEEPPEALFPEDVW